MNKRLIKKKQQKLTPEARIIGLANQLVKECVKIGLIVDGSCEGLDIWIFNKEKLRVQDIIQNFQIDGFYEGENK